MLTERDAHMVAPGRRRRGQERKIGMRDTIGYDFLGPHVGQRTGTRDCGEEAEGSLFAQI